MELTKQDVLGIKQWKKEATGKAATMEEALEKTHFGKFNIQLILFSGLVMNNVMLETIGVSFSLPVVACDLDLSYQQQGLLCAVCFLGMIVSSHFWGLLADTRGRKRTMRPALLIGFIVTIISSFSLNFNMMVITRFFSGVFISAGSATIFAYLGEFHCQKYSNKAILYGTLMSECSAILFPVIVWIFINQEWAWEIPFLGITYKPWRLFFVACGVQGFCCGLAFQFLPESPKYLLGMGRTEEALAVLKFMHNKNTHGREKLKNDKFEITALLPDFETPLSQMQNVEKQKSAFTVMKVIWDQTAPLFMSQHLRKTVLAALLQFITYFTAHGIYMWFTYILNQVILYTDQYSDGKRLCDIVRFTQSSNFTNIVHGKDETVCATKLEISTIYHSIVIEALYVVILLFVIYACRTFKRPLVLFILFTFCGLCGILSLLIKIPILSIYLFVLLVCCGTGTCVISTIVVDIYPTNLRAMAMCISLMMGRAGSVAGSNLLGVLIESHCEEALYGSAISVIIAGLMGFLLPKRQTKQIQPVKAEEGNSM